LPGSNLASSVKDCHGSLYLDDGHTFAYQKGELLRVNYSCQVSQGSVTLTSTAEKSAFQPWWKSAEVTLYGAATLPKEVRIGDERTHEWRYDDQAHAVILTVPNAVNNWSVHLTF
jgi:alpha-glucosidase